MIWGCLDTQAYLDAARRYLRAAEVHSLLMKAAPTELRTKFPLVNRQWPNIQKFRCGSCSRDFNLKSSGFCMPFPVDWKCPLFCRRSQITEHIAQRLTQQESQSTRDFAVALAAAALLEGLDSHQVGS